MGFKGLNDADGNGLKDVAQPKPENKFDLSDSDEVADKLKREDLQSVEESPDKKRLLDKADPAGLEGFPKSLESDLGSDGGRKEQSPPDEVRSIPSKDVVEHPSPDGIPASLEGKNEFEEVTRTNPLNQAQKPQEHHVAEGELSSPFAKENFREENSFDARAKAEHPDLNTLKSKCVYDVQPMGTPSEQIDRSAKGIYSDEERMYIKDIRDSVDAPNENTVMQKVIGVDTGDVEKDLERYLNPRDFNGAACEAHVTGCVAKAEDAAPFTKTPQECFDNLRLDYSETPYQNPNQAVYAIRFTNGTNYEVPYGAEFAGNKECAAPMTGNGFTGSAHHIIPENTVQPVDSKGAIVTDGEIYRINPNGAEQKVAYYDKDLKYFVLYDEEDLQ